MKDPQRKNILIIDDDISITDSLTLILQEAGFRVVDMHTVADSITILNSTQFDLVITDFCLPDGTGIDVITHVKNETPQTEVILMTGHGSLDITIGAIKRGAYYYLEKPFDVGRLRTLVDRALEVVSMTYR